MNITIIDILDMIIYSLKLFGFVYVCYLFSIVVARFLKIQRDQKYKDIYLQNWIRQRLKERQSIMGQAVGAHCMKDRDSNKNVYEMQCLDCPCSNLDHFQNVLALIGMLPPPVGVISDVLDAGVSALRGQYGDSILHLTAAVPGPIGWSATGTDIISPMVNINTNKPQTWNDGIDQLIDDSGATTDEEARLVAR